jgi:hypothetical protein
VDGRVILAKVKEKSALKHKERDKLSSLIINELVNQRELKRVFDYYV